MDFYGTLGGACSSRAVLERMFQAGMTGARLNLSHTTLTQCADLLEQVYWPAARRLGIPARLIIDLQGPELRVGPLKAPVPLSDGAAVVLGGGIPVPPIVVETAQSGDRISLDDSSILLRVTDKTADGLVCQVERGGTLRSRKSLAILGVQPNTPTLTQEDLDNLEQAARFGVTDVLQPFVRGREDVELLRAVLEKKGLSSVRIMAKIENRQGLAKLDEILDTADIVCIARGDLGNSMPLWELPSVQKDIAARCQAAGRPFFVVTQLLWSMEQRAVPTRAEVSDIYNAVLDGSCALMLTGETAAGHYPVEAMEYLVKTAQCALTDRRRQAALPEARLAQPPKPCYTV